METPGSRVKSGAQVLGGEAGASQVGWGAEDLGAGLAALLGALTLWGLGDVD